MANRLRAAVIGCGVGAYHAYAYSQNPDVDLVAACDLNPAAFERFYARAKLAPGSVREYADYHQLLERERPDLVSVATPDSRHAAPVIAAAQAGARAILTEKPFATSLPDADAMIAAAERAGTHLLVDHTRCFEPHHTEARRRVREGYLGALTRIVATFGGPRAMLFRNTTHLLGSVCFFAQSAPQWVIAALDPHPAGLSGGYGTEYDHLLPRDPANDPGAMLLIGFANGVRAAVIASKGTPSVGIELDLLGTRGRLIVGDRETRAWQCATDQGTPEPQEVTWTQHLAGSDLGMRLAPAVRQLVRLARGEQPGPGDSPAHEGRYVLEIMLAALRSAASGMSPVSLPLPRP